MAFIALTCPHCLSKTQLKVIGFNFDTTSARKVGQEVALGTFCPGCLKPVAVLAKREEATDQAFSHQIGQLLASQLPISASKLSYLDHWPKQPDPQIPAHLPKPVEKAFIQAEKNFPLEGHEEAAGLMYRRSLELALGEKYPDKNGSLAAVIKELVKEKVLTEDIGN